MVNGCIMLTGIGFSLVSIEGMTSIAHLRDYRQALANIKQRVRSSQRPEQC